MVGTSTMGRSTSLQKREQSSGEPRFLTGGKRGRTGAAPYGFAGCEFGEFGESWEAGEYCGAGVGRSGEAGTLAAGAWDAASGALGASSVAGCGMVGKTGAVVAGCVGAGTSGCAINSFWICVCPALALE